MRILPFLFPRYTWQKSKQDKVIYLTFDDGPIPEVTEWVLDVLQQQQIPATFFCIGDNIRKHPAIFQRIIAEQHRIGNHTFHHVKGWETPLEDYIANVKQCQQEIVKHHKEGTSLFRPPYGKITKKQANYLLNQGYEIIMWSIITKDYEADLSPQQCLKRTIKRITPGSIIVFHDSLKAEKNMKYALPLLLEYLKKEGYSFATL
ncbi:polysaccharide deacetylase family protein [Myroides odoratus]|uniref:polysaccharide deacetylase family protein n=1 Tax=Myroides odoratus TaxID=256 RepID=UPI000765E524|nr:polysaccharide deacetylase family protein [Myroides odoratus]